MSSIFVKIFQNELFPAASAAMIKVNIFTPCFDPTTATMSKSKPSKGHMRVPANRSAEKGLFDTGIEVPNVFSKSFYYALAVLGITFLSFFPSLKNDFMPTWDDEKYVTANPVIRELDEGSIRKMFTRPVNGSYVPLPLLTFAIEYKMFGNAPLPFHVTNLILHLLCTLLVFRILRLLRIDLIYAAFGALLFGIHPMHVESVAWISERKDVLYSAFYLAAIITYIRYVTESPDKSKFPLYIILLFLGSLLSKIEAVTLPLSLLLVDYILKRPFRIKLLTEKIPYFILSILFGMLGIYIIYKAGLHGADILNTVQLLSFTDRFFYGLYAITGYIFKFFVPFSQSAIYPYPALTGLTLAWIRFINPVVIGIFIFLVYRSAGKTRAVAFGTLFFLVNIFFLLQIFAVGNAFFADRYIYIPYLGLVFITVWFAGEVVRKNAARKLPVLVILSIFSAGCIVLTFARCSVWKDGVSLWSDLISQYPGRSMESYVNRGIAYTLRQDLDHAAEDYTTALAIGPVSAGVYADRGIVYGLKGQPELAVADFSNAVRLDPKNSKALFNRGVTYGNLGETGMAIMDFRKVVALDPLNVSAYAGLSIMMIGEKKFDSCMILAEKGLQIDPYRADLYALLGNCQIEKGDPGKSIDNFRHCLRIDDHNLDAYLGLAAAFILKDDHDNAWRYLNLARQAAHEKNTPLENMEDIGRSGITLLDTKKEALKTLLAQKR